MEIKKTQKIVDALSDRFKDVWKLLSETSLFLSRAGEIENYDSQLRQWRAELQSFRKNPQEIQRIRLEIIALRKSLRLLGYDLSLGGQYLILDGFRNDAALAEGFRRVVLYLTTATIYYLAGDGNHIELANYLERQLITERAITEHNRILDKHYLWYARQGQNLYLSGSDTEGKDDYERLKAEVDANVFLFLRCLKKLR
ncbi:MAG: hypothetical protein LBI91_05975 [Spirochaetaceae bacterium]|jgi:hypothetical protein|nr:hypothetical protein [Spirochaetaceae bacterium]